MRKRSQRLLIMEIALSLGLLILALSLSFGFFFNALKQHRLNLAMHKMTEVMLILSEDLRNNQDVIIDKQFDAQGEIAESGQYRLTSISIEGGVELRLMEVDKILLAWPIWTGAQP